MIRLAFGCSFYSLSEPEDISSLARLCLGNSRETISSLSYLVITRGLFRFVCAYLRLIWLSSVPTFWSSNLCSKTGGGDRPTGIVFLLGVLTHKQFKSRERVCLSCWGLVNGTALLMLEPYILILLSIRQQSDHMNWDAPHFP